MSGKSMKTMKGNGNQDLQKQIGCITGFFHLFDRHRFLTAASGGSSNSSNDIKDVNTVYKATATKNLKVAREKRQFSTESSITSMSSSSCSSSMSSLEFNRTIQTESLSASRDKIPENQNSQLATKRLDTPVRQSLDFYDIVKDSMHRESQGLSLKTAPKEQKKGQNHTLKYIDSPRPLLPVSGEISHNFAKSKKTPWDSPRFSYDERDTRDTFRTATKHKELPRLSLDSRERSQKGHARNSSTTVNEPQEPETSRRSSSVVAKLMGLEGLPDCTHTCDTSLGTTCCSSNKNELLARSRTSDEYKQRRGSVSPRNFQGMALPQSRRADLITNVTPYNRFALESSPWRQPDDASQSSQLQVPKGSESDVKASKPSLSVYGEIEKRLAELEFKKSGKDLRALKQILEAMQRQKDPYETTSDQASNSSSDNRNYSGLNQSSKVQSPRIRQKDPTFVTTEMSNTNQGSQLPIVIMKSARVTRKADNPSSTGMSIRGKSGLGKCCPSNPTNGRLVDKQTDRGISSTIRNVKDPCGQPIQSKDKSNHARTLKSMQSLKVPQNNSGENTNSGNLTVTSRPRLQKKFSLERRSPPSSPSSDSSINRKQQHNRNSVEFSSSPSATPRQKFSSFQGRNECFSEISCQWRDFKHHVNVISPDFDRKRSLSTHSDIEVIRIDQSGKIDSTSIQLGGLNQNIAVMAEQPSPVSVLDTAFYREDPPSPVRKKSAISEDSSEALSADDDSKVNSVNLPLSNTTKSNFSTESCHRQLSTRNLVQILQEIDWNDEKLIGFSDSKDPDHKYIAEILLASGLLNGPTSSQISRLPVHLINPKLYFALEQRKTNMTNFDIEDNAEKTGSITNPEPMQRKLIFDVINDILVRKFVLGSFYNLKGKHLFDQVCTEIDHLKPQNRNVSMANEDENLENLLRGDLMHHPTVWTSFRSEIPNIALDIERLIFKDLITEVVRGEVANNLGRHCRQLLFHK